MRGWLAELAAAAEHDHSARPGLFSIATRILPGFENWMFTPSCVAPAVDLERLRARLVVAVGRRRDLDLACPAVTPRSVN